MVNVLRREITIITQENKTWCELLPLDTSEQAWDYGENLRDRVVRKVDNTIDRINHYPVESVVCSVHSKAIYPVDSVNEPSNNRGLYYIGCYQI